MQIDEKLKHDKYQTREVIDEDRIETKYALLSYSKVQGANHDQIIRLYAIKQGEAEWRIRVDVHGSIKEKKGNAQISSSSS